MSKSIRTLIIIWLAWAALLIVFQNIVPQRLVMGILAMLYTFDMWVA